MKYDYNGLEMGVQVKNRHRIDSKGNYTQFGEVVGFEGCLILIKIHNRNYDGYKTDYNYCVPKDWVKVN